MELWCLYDYPESDYMLFKCHTVYKVQKGNNLSQVECELEWSYEKMKLDYTLTRKDLSWNQLKMIGQLHMDQMSLLWPAVVMSEDSSSMYDSDSMISRTEEQVKIILNQRSCLLNQRRIKQGNDEKTPYTMQLFSISKKIPHFLIVSVYDRIRCIEIGVVLFVQKERLTDEQGGSSFEDKLIELVSKTCWSFIEHNIKVTYSEDNTLQV